MIDNRPVSTALSRAPSGLSAPLVRVEVHLGSGLPAFFMVGLSETAVRDSKERVRSALLTAGFSFPPGRITVNFVSGRFAEVSEGVKNWYLTIRTWTR